MPTLRELEEIASAGLREIQATKPNSKPKPVQPPPPPSVPIEPESLSPQELEVRKLGGRARAEKLSPARRSEIARQAANARWNK